VSRATVLRFRFSQATSAVTQSADWTALARVVIDAIVAE